MAFLIKAKFRDVVVPLGPAVIVLKVEVSRVIRMGLRVIDRSLRGLPSAFEEKGAYDDSGVSLGVSVVNVEAVMMRVSRRRSFKVFMIRI
jgi:hypothetical protein